MIRACAFFPTNSISKTNSKWRAFCFIAILLLGGCSKQPPKQALTPDQVKKLVCGQYVGEYAGGKEYFEIKPDMTFSQRFETNGKTSYDLKGKWSIDPQPVENGGWEGVGYRIQPIHVPGGDCFKAKFGTSGKGGQLPSRFF